MTFSRMNNKSSYIHTACAASTPGNLSNNKFLRDYYKVVKHYLDDGLSEQMPRFPSIRELRSMAEKEFIHSYGLFPTCCVYAPGCLTIAGKSTDLAESKSLSMTALLRNKQAVEPSSRVNICLRLSSLEIKQAIQLVTLVVGKRTHGNDWCQVRTLSDKIDEQKTVELCLNDEHLQVSAEETWWIRYLKGAIQSFKARRAHVPGFQIVIASSLPVKRGLGSNSALVVAFYTFLEGITNTYTGNVIEKTLACHLAEKVAAGSSNVRITDILASILGVEGKVLALDSQTLDMERFNWYGTEVEFILIELTNIEKSASPEWRTEETRYKQIMTVLNTMPRWRSHLLGESMMELVFSDEVLAMTKNVVDENERIVKMTDAIQGEQWEKLGELLWENHHSAYKYLSFSPDDIEHIASVLKSMEGVLGVCVTGYGASLVVLVRRSKLKKFVSFMNRTKISKQYYIMKSCKGATTIYTYERRLHPWHVKPPSRPKLVIKYKLSDKYRIKKA